jgi:putative DNA primase/helicase
MARSSGGGSVEEEGRALVERLGGRWTPSGGMCRCPAHVDRTPSLSVRPGRTRLLLHCFAGCSASDVLGALSAQCLLDKSAQRAEAPAGAEAGASMSAAAQRIWSEGRSIRGTPAQAYLAARSIHADSPALRYHARTPSGRRPLVEYRPALIAAVRDEAGLTGIHRTFIDPQLARLAALRDPKCGLGRFGRGAVRLRGAGPVLGLAEGIETALSASLLFGVPCWATLGTERFGLIALPDGVRELKLFLDHDAGGRRAEALAREAFSHVQLIAAHYPPRRGDDWNDVLRSGRCIHAEVKERA